MPSRRRPRLPIARRHARERQVFREAAASPYARALQYAFFAERQAANLPGIGPDAKLRDDQDGRHPRRRHHGHRHRRWRSSTAASP